MHLNSTVERWCQEHHLFNCLDEQSTALEVSDTTMLIIEKPFAPQNFLRLSKRPFQHFFPACFFAIH
jgi:hypothetical protein